MQRIQFFLLALLTFSLSAPLSAQNEAQIEVREAFREGIQKLAQNTVVTDVFLHIFENNAKTLEDLVFLNEIPAPPFKEEIRAKAFKDMLDELGVDSSWIDAEGNVIALRKGTEGKRTIALDAHLDTVFPEGTEVDVTTNQDTFFAPGIGDDTRGLSMVLAVLRAMNNKQIQTRDDILFIGTVGEEGLGDLRGVKHLFSDAGPKIDAWISIDGGDLGRVNFKGLGSYRYRVVIKGPGGHSWGAFGLGNPHHALAAGINHFVRDADQYTKSGPKTSYNIGRMGGGTSVNSIPFSSWAEIDIRSHRPERLEDMEKILRNAMQRGLEEQNEIRRRGRPLILEIEMIGNRPSGELSPDLPLIQRALAAAEVFDIEPAITRGSTNSNTPISMGIPAVTIGRGGEGAWAHSLLEWWADKEGYKATQYALLLLLAESGLIE